MRYNFYSMSSGGICNRLKIMASLMRLSGKTNSKFYFYWPKNRLCNINFGDIFQSIPGEINKSSASYALGLADLKLYKDSENCFNFPREKNIIFTGWRFLFSDKDNIPKSKECLYFDQRNLDYEFHSIPSKIKEEYILHLKKIRPVNKLQRIIREFDKEYRLSSKIGIHMRRGDFKEASEISTDKKFIEKISQIIKKHPKEKFFLCTDSIESERKIKKRFGEKIIIFKKSSFNRLDKIFLEESVIELYLLSKTKMIIGSCLSSFTEIAWWIGGGRAKIDIIADKKEFLQTIKKRKKINLFLKIKSFIYQSITPLSKRVLDSNKL